MHLLEGIRVKKAFGGVAALDGVDFHIDSGEIVGLIGPNGAGKTTLFNVISGIHVPEEGVIKLKGKNITRMKPHKIARRGIARTFQVTQPFAMMSVLQNIIVGALFGNERRTSLKDAASEAERIISLHRKRGDLSWPGGSLQLQNCFFLMKSWLD